MTSRVRGKARTCLQMIILLAALFISIELWIIVNAPNATLGLELWIIVNSPDVTLESRRTFTPLPPTELSSRATVAIVTLNTGDGSQKYLQAIHNHQVYTKCHGYDYFNAAELLDKGTRSVHPYMQKAYALQSIIQRYPSSKYKHIVWIDRDAIFVNHKISIEHRLIELEEEIVKREGTFVAGMDGYDLLIAVEPWAWINSGVMIFRNSAFSAKLIADWIETYHSRKENYDSAETIEIQGSPKYFRDLFDPKWSCEDQGALIALLAGFNSTENKWNTDKYDGLGKPHLLHQGHGQWAELSSRILLASKYQSNVRVVAQEWFNTNPWDHEKYQQASINSVEPFIFHFNGQKDKPGLIADYDKKVTSCSSFTCYHSMDYTVCDIRDIVKVNSDSVTQADTLGMTLLHILALAQRPNVELFRQLPDFANMALSSTDFSGSTPPTYLAKNTGSGSNSLDGKDGSGPKSSISRSRSMDARTPSCE